MSSDNRNMKSKDELRIKSSYWKSNILKELTPITVAFIKIPRAKSEKVVELFSDNKETQHVAM